MSERGFSVTVSNAGSDYAADHERPAKKRRAGGRDRISQACNTCRIRKTRCSGDRPCKFCREKGIACSDMAVADEDAPAIRRVNELEIRLRELESGLGTRLQQLEVNFANFSSQSPKLRAQIAGLDADIDPNLGVAPNTYCHQPASVSAGACNNDDWGSRYYASDTVSYLNYSQTPSPKQSRHIQRPHDSSGLSGVESSNPAVTFLRKVPIPSMLAMIEALHSGRSVAGSPTDIRPIETPLTLKSIFEILAKSDSPYSCYEAEDTQSSILFGTDGTRRMYPSGPQALVVDRLTCRRLRDRFFQTVVSWLPIISPESWLEHFHIAQACQFRNDNLSVGLVYLTFALGMAGQVEDAGELPGAEFFRKGVEILGREGSFRTELKITQCKFLVAVYCLLALQPRPAAIAVSEAAHQCFMLKRHRPWNNAASQDERDPYCRVFWCCAVLEGEVTIHIRSRCSNVTDELDLKSDWPNLTDSRQSMFFLAETRIRQIQSDLSSDFIVREEISPEKPIISSAHQSRLETWHSILPTELKFGTDDANDLFDERKAFLRMQYHCVQTLCGWPIIVALLEMENNTFLERVLEKNDRKMGIKRFMRSSVLIIEGADEQMARRNVFTWLVSEALTITMVKFLLACRSTLLSTLRPPNWIEVLHSGLELLVPWRSCLRIDRSYTILKEILDIVIGETCLD